MAEVRLQNITKHFGENRVIEEFNLVINDGEFVTLLGPSGCGKTTLLRMIAGLEQIDSGDLLIGGKRCNDVPAQNRKLAMVFQSYALFPHMTVRSNIVFGLRIQKASKSFIEKKLDWALGLLGLHGLESRLPREISGGQRQRVALARALVLDPEVLLLDEPLSNLDSALRDMATEELKRIHQKVGKTIIYVTHNQVEALTMSQRIAIINNGVVEQYDKPREVYDTPRTIFAAEFIGSPSMNFVDGQISTRDNEMGIDTAMGFIRLDKERAALIADKKGQKVRLGIRPQNISYVAHGLSRRYSDTTISLTIELVESMGDRSLVVARSNGCGPIRFLITRDEDLSDEENVTVFIDGRRIHLFNPRTHKNIFTEIQGHALLSEA